MRFNLDWSYRQNIGVEIIGTLLANWKVAIRFVFRRITMTWKMGTIVTLTLVLLLLPASLAQQNQPEQSAPETQQQQQPYAQSQPTSFTGTIVKNSNKLVLKTEAGETYQLDDQQQAKRFEGKAVTITGSVDGKAKKMTIHVESIQPST